MDMRVRSQSPAVGRGISPSLQARTLSLRNKGVHQHQLTPAEQNVMDSFQTLDYDMCENELYRERKRNYTSREVRERGLLVWSIYAIIGVATGVCGFFIAIGVETLLEIRFGTQICPGVAILLGAEPAWLLRAPRWVAGVLLKLMDEGRVMAAWLTDVTLAMAFVGVATGLVVWIEPASSGSGIPDLKAYLNGTNLRQLLTVKALVCKVVGVLFSVGGGLCVGKEGPMVHTGAVVAANVSHGWRGCGVKHWKSFRNDTDKRNFVSGGCAAGVAAAFGAPIGGVLFSLEEASSFWSLVSALSNRRLDSDCRDSDGRRCCSTGPDLEVILQRDGLDVHDQPLHLDLPRRLWRH